MRSDPPPGHDFTQRRFAASKPHGDRAAAALPANHPALREARTVFRAAVVPPGLSPRLLVSGHNNPKLGTRIAKGPWAGLPIFHLTLEERATCPRSCHLWRECFGNAMPMARRHAHGPALERRLRAELRALAREHPRGFAVRLHTLGDFYSLRYAARWAAWLRTLPGLRVFGFTAHPHDSPIGRLITRMNARWPDRCAIRTSVPAPTGAPMEATTLWGTAPPPEGALICPAQTGRTDCCATCGLCWHPAMATTPIAFLGHGKRAGRRDRSASATAPATAPAPAAPATAAPAAAPPADPAAPNPWRIALMDLEESLRKRLDTVRRLHETIPDRSVTGAMMAGLQAALDDLLAATAAAEAARAEAKAGAAAAGAAEAGSAPPAAQAAAAADDAARRRPRRASDKPHWTQLLTPEQRRAHAQKIAEARRRNLARRAAAPGAGAAADPPEGQAKVPAALDPPTGPAIAAAAPAPLSEPAPAEAAERTDAGLATALPHGARTGADHPEPAPGPAATSPAAATPPAFTELMRTARRREQEARARATLMRGHGITAAVRASGLTPAEVRAMAEQISRQRLAIAAAAEGRMPIDAASPPPPPTRAATLTGQAA